MQLEKWAERRILIFGMTYPSYSRKYVENVCTGGLDSENLQMVRLHPIPHRYMEDGSRFHSFQWISARVMPHQSAPRPESLRVEPDSIRVGEQIPAAQMQERVRLLRKSPSRVRSVEDLHALEKSEKRSLGIVQLKEITGIRLRTKTEAERRDWLRIERLILRQQAMFGTPKPLDFPEADFVVSWVCDDPVWPDGHVQRADRAAAVAFRVMVRRWLAAGGAGALPALRPAAQVPRFHGTCGRVNGAQRGAELDAALREGLAEVGQPYGAQDAAEVGQPYGAQDAAEEVLLAKAESRGIMLENDGKSVDIPPEVVAVRNEDEISTQPSWCRPYSREARASCCSPWTLQAERSSPAVPWQLSLAALRSPEGAANYPLDMASAY